MIKRATGLLGAFEPSAWYRFTVAAPSTVNLDLGLAFGTAVVGLYDSSGSALIQSDPATTAGDGWIDRFLASGTYSVQVSSRGDAAYTLTLSSGVPPVGVSTTLYAGTSQAAATALGTLGATPLTIPEWIGPGNPDDWYAFTVASVSSVQATLSGLSNGVTVTLYTTAGQLVASATGTASSNASLLRTVAAGNYLLDIGGAAASGYSLSLAAPPVPEGAGPTAALARDFGVLGSAGAQVVDQLNAADSADYYQFEVGTNAAVALLLSGVTDAATVTLYDGSGAVLSSRSAGLASNAWLNSDLAPLPVGTSYVIGITGTRPTSYTLKLSEAPYVKITGATAGTATDAGTLGPSSVTLAGTLRPLANNQYYSFTLDTPQTVSIAVTAEQSTLLQLYGSDGSSIGRTNPPGTAPGTILAYYALQAGTYYADITDDSTIGAQNYSINLSTASPLVGTPDTNFAGITPATAQVIGLLSPAVTSFADWVGATNPDDYYQFTLGTESYARFDLTGLTENATVTISDLTGRVLFTQPSSVYSAATGYDASVTALLLAGSYILDVSDPSQVGTGYNLNASAAAVSDPAGHTRATADALGSVDVTPQSVSGVIAPLVPDDYYTFILTRAGTVNLLLSNTTQVASISLRDSAGQPLGSSQTAASPGSSVMEAASLIQTLAPGTYVVDVQAAANAASPYTLGLSASPVTLSGNAAINATGLGTLRNTAGQPIALEDFGLRGTSIVSGPATGHVLTNGVTVDTVGATTPIRFIDGTLYYDPSAPAAQVLRLYQAGLGRAPPRVSVPPIQRVSSLSCIKTSWAAHRTRVVSPFGSTGWPRAAPRPASSAPFPKVPRTRAAHRDRPTAGSGSGTRSALKSPGYMTRCSVVNRTSPA